MDHGIEIQLLWRARTSQEHKWRQESLNYESDHFCTKNTTSIDFLPLTTLHAFDGIKRKHSDMIGRGWYKDLTSITEITEGVIVWEGICWETQSFLVIFQATMTVQSCVHRILTTIVLRILLSFPGAFYYQDNIRSHIAKFPQCFLQGVSTSIACQVIRPLTNRACLGHDGRTTALVTEYW